MSKAVNSPTARLLQSSRLFSLPRPLPSPDLSNNASTGIFRSSETASTPYPTYQAIATTPSSLHRGDWGLKRSLPNKRLRGTKPTVRVRAQDTWEHVTSFESAGDHVRTLEKWSEMGIPMMMKPKEQRGRGPAGGSQTEKPMSVYDESVDSTDKDAARRQIGQGRWKYDGPWLGGMQEGEFNKWLLQQVSKRRDEWREFLRQREMEKRVDTAFANARAEGNPMSAADIEQLRKTSRPTDEQLQDIHKSLRDDHTQDQLSSELTELITTFLDLPAVPREGSQNSEEERFMNSLASGLSTERGPPSTHPSAGLSHTRTGAIMENHPVYGPQAARTPVQARVVRPRTSAGVNVENRAKLGVGGVVAEDSLSATLTNQDSSRYKAKDVSDPAQVLDPTTPGGGKLWVQPRYAYVDENGHIRLQLGRADREAIAVKTGDVEDIEAEKRGDASRMSALNLRQGPSANYGTSLGVGRQPRAEQAPRPRSNVEGFDRELKAGASASDEIQNLMARGLR